MDNFYQSTQGNLGLGRAISFFVSHGYIVSLPLNDTQKYDLIVEMPDGLKKISVKTTQQTRTKGKSYIVGLRNTGGNRTGKTRIVKFNKEKVDFLFIYVIDEKIYLIPTQDLDNVNSITIGEKYKKYEVQNKTFFENASEW